MKRKLAVFHIIDLDRTLIDTSKLAKHLKEIVAIDNPDLALAIENEIQKYAQLNTSFFIFEFIAKHTGYDVLDKYIDELSAVLQASELLLPGAKSRMAFSNSQPEWGMGILTYGSPHDQEIKLKLAGLDSERRMITDNPKKGAVIASWKLPDGTYELPIEFGGQIADVLIFDDDKLVAFDDLPSDVLGQWITRASVDKIDDSQSLPENIQQVADLEASVMYLKTKLVR
jgi:hypothetical protein